MSPPDRLNLPRPPITEIEGFTGRGRNDLTELFHIIRLHLAQKSQREVKILLSGEGAAAGICPQKLRRPGELPADIICEIYSDKKTHTAASFFPFHKNHTTLRGDLQENEYRPFRANMLMYKAKARRFT
jgi:hypothetical protein